MKGLKSLEILNQSTTTFTSSVSFELNEEGIFLHADSHFLRLLRRELDDVEGKSYKDLIPSTYLSSETYKRLWEDLRRGKHRTKEDQWIRRDGTDVRVLVNFIPMLNEIGELVKVIGLVSEVTGMKSQVAELRMGDVLIHRRQFTVAY